jgi:hypothetical protein
VSNDAISTKRQCHPCLHVTVHILVKGDEIGSSRRLAFADLCSVVVSTGTNNEARVNGALHLVRILFMGVLDHVSLKDASITSSSTFIRSESGVSAIVVRVRICDLTLVEARRVVNNQNNQISVTS